MLSSDGFSQELDCAETCPVICDMAAKIAHDLKGPLQTITSYLECMTTYMREGKFDEARRFSASARKGALHLAQFIDDLIEYSKSNFSKRDLDLVDTSKIMNDIVEQNNWQIMSAGAQIITSHMPIIQAHAIPIKLILQNLILNAALYTRESVPPEIKINIKKDGLNWLFEVQDNGRGIHQEELQDIFHLFRRGTNVSDIQGTGVGLATCKKLVENMGGKIWVKSKLGEGSIFSFTIPVESVD